MAVFVGRKTEKRVKETEREREREKEREREREREARKLDQSSVIKSLVLYFLLDWGRS